MQVTDIMIVCYDGGNHVGSAHVNPELAKVMLQHPDAESGTLWAAWEGAREHVFVGVNGLVQELMHDAMTEMEQ